MTDKPTPLQELQRAFESGAISKDAFATLAAQYGDGALAQGDSARALGAKATSIEGGNTGPITNTDFDASQGGTIVYAADGAKVVIGDAPVNMPNVDHDSVLGKYLQHLISNNRYLQLQGIRKGGKIVNIELDRIYVTLRTTRQLTPAAQREWLASEAVQAPGERHRAQELMQDERIDTTHVTVNDALAQHKRLVVLGDPGSGKTTLLRYIALLFARDLAEGTQLVKDELGLDPQPGLPIFLPLRQIGRYLMQQKPTDDGTDGHALLFDFYRTALANERVDVPADFFDERLATGDVVFLLDGLDEVANPEHRRRVSRLVDKLTRAYPNCRVVVSSRIVGYTDHSQLSEGYVTTTVRDFRMEDVRAFLSQWHRVIAIGQMGPGEAAEVLAAGQTESLLESIERNDRVRELAINPLMLTVIALVHKDRVKLPDRRAELYDEAVNVLLGNWDEARGVPDMAIFEDRNFDANDRRLVLQQVALEMHEQGVKEIDAEPLRRILQSQLTDGQEPTGATKTVVDRFLDVIGERTGLLIARAEGTYAFSHLTFQEYLAAVAVATRDDYVKYT
ncbi:MAG: NACHT domain-containing protein, partial [Pseudomonadota bacterium]